MPQELIKRTSLKTSLYGEFHLNDDPCEGETADKAVIPAGPLMEVGGLHCGIVHSFCE